jgi:peptidoglycan/LPS O-acetylase OafA/YrhL
MVFANHYLRLPWGWAGVDVFFVLSGFLITGILFDTREQANRVRSFYVRRILRIFPLYFGLMLALVLLYPIFRWDWSWSWLLWPAFLGNFARGQHVFAVGSPLQMLADAQPLSRSFPRIQLFCGHLWSLCVEEQFYLIWPGIVFWLRNRRQLLWVCLS